MSARKRDEAGQHIAGDARTAEKAEAVGCRRKRGQGVSGREGEAAGRGDECGQVGVSLEGAGTGDKRLEPDIADQQAEYQSGQHGRAAPPGVRTQQADQREKQPDLAVVIDRCQNVQNGREPVGAQVRRDPQQELVIPE